ncbi:MAG TPA: glycosyltransferase family 39 protein [Candidatus Saccharimonadales bacterium]|nr:glycosyltransferase family 39 protein [Candidatus Saccharimonadales bacterium]
MSRDQESFWKKNKKKITVIIAIAIFSIGLFLRATHFHDWLDFGDDQVNDASIVTKVVDHNAPWPLLGPKMSHTGNGGRKGQYHLGSMFYYFEITSAKLFGNRPDALAYPDLLFDILTLPLFYIFFRRFFSTNITLALTGLYAVSFYVLNFSHSALNPNLIPFFVLLFLFSLLEFLAHKEKTSWKWAVFLGLALGVGIQLHAILLVLLPLVTAVVFFFLLRKYRQDWKKWGAVLLIALILNAGQIVSEIRTNFANTRIFFISLQSSGSGSGNGTLLNNIPLDISCHVQANAYILSSLGDSQCNFSYTNPAQWRKISLGSWANLLFGILFSVFGYGFLIYKFRREKEEKRKYLLGLALLFVSCFFVVFLPVVASQYRYFLPVFFAPFFFLGFILDYFARKNFQKFLPFLVLIYSLVLAANYLSIQTAAKELLTRARNGKDHIVLGETETMVNYIIAHTPGGQREAYLMTSMFSHNCVKPLKFIAGENRFKLLIASDVDHIPPGKQAFYIQSSEGGSDETSSKFAASENFGQETIYQLRN